MSSCKAVVHYYTYFATYAYGMNKEKQYEFGAMNAVNGMKFISISLYIYIWREQCE